jgi:serine/threonine protein kinase
VCSLQIQKILGKGSYGTAYRAKRHSDSKLYAIKVCLLSTRNL